MPEATSIDPDSIQDQIPGNGPGAEPVRPSAIAWLAVYLFILALGLLTGLYFAWSAWSDGEKPVKTSAGTIEPSHGPVAGGTVVTVTGVTAFPKNPILHFGGVEVKSEPAGNANKALSAVAPRHDTGRVAVDIVDKDTGKSVATFSYMYGQPFNPWLFILVVLAGGLGASLHALRSLYWYVGNRKAVESWLLMYMLLPWTGALMATVFYLIISAGLMTPEQASNPLIAVGIAVLVGMFSREAAQKLENIADALFTKASNGADAGKDSQATLQVIAVDPPSGKTAGGDKVTIKGIGFSDTPTVLFDTAVAPSVTSTSPTSLTVITPPHGAGKVDVTVKTATTSAKAEKAFTYADGQAADADEVYTQQGSTTHFVVHYAQSLGDNGPALADAVLATCEADYDRLQEWFGNIEIGSLPFNVYIRPGEDGASHPTCLGTALTCDAFNGTDADLVRSLVVMEEDEVFMANQAAGWDCGASNGEALSRILAAEIYPKELTPPGTDVTFATGTDWLDSDREDFVNKNDPTDLNFVSIGCGALFINWLRFQLNHDLGEIVQTGGSTLAGTYTKLTNQTDGFERFSALLAKHFPPGQPSGLTDDNPFPLSED